MREYHKAVLLSETISLLAPGPGGVYVDGTLGGGGHSREILERIGPDGVLVGIDRDPEAIEYNRENLRQYADRLVLVQGNFKDIDSILDTVGYAQVDGMLLDLGVSSHQLDADRGFTFQRDERLDMRMSAAEEGPSAADVVNDYSETDLADIIWRYGEERYSRRVARAIIERRREKHITTTGELAEIVQSAIGVKYRGQDIHPATRTFQAIRIEVNQELHAIEAVIPAAVERLKIGGRICIISFHSLEDRIVKNVFRKLSGRCECPPRLPECQCGARKVLEILTRKPITPTAEEVKDNPRARSSKLRCAERVA